MFDVQIVGSAILIYVFFTFIALFSRGIGRRVGSGVVNRRRASFEGIHKQILRETELG